MAGQGDGRFLAEMPPVQETRQRIEIRHLEEPTVVVFLDEKEKTRPPDEHDRYEHVEEEPFVEHFGPGKKVKAE